MTEVETNMNLVKLSVSLILSSTCFFLLSAATSQAELPNALCEEIAEYVFTIHEIGYLKHGDMRRNNYAAAYNRLDSAIHAARSKVPQSTCSRIRELAVQLRDDSERATTLLRLDSNETPQFRKAMEACLRTRRDLVSLCGY